MATGQLGAARDAWQPGLSGKSIAAPTVALLLFSHLDPVPIAETLERTHPEQGVLQESSMQGIAHSEET
jgi:hypothetical protein